MTCNTLRTLHHFFAHAYFCLLPVVCEGLVVLGIERAGGRKHDGGVQICDDARDCAGCCNASLRAFVACLER